MGLGVGLGIDVSEGRYGAHLFLESLLHALQTAVHQGLDEVRQSLLGFSRYSLLLRVTGGKGGRRREWVREGGRTALPGLISSPTACT